MSTYTPGPWKWVLNPKYKSVELTRGDYGSIVMSFARWGMHGATPAFVVDGVIRKAVELSMSEPGREHHADWWRVLRHPDADIIAASPELLEALQRVLRWMPYSSSTDSSVAQDYAFARAVIQKANGVMP